MGAEPEADTMGTCPNCHSLVMGPFCSSCGQPQDTHRRTIGKLIGDLLIDIASFDSRVMRTGWALLFRPGELACAFREGRTQRYVPAVRLYLFVSLAFFLFLSVSGVSLLQLELKYGAETVAADAQGRVYAVENGGKRLLPNLVADNAGNVFRTEDGKRVNKDGRKVGKTTYALYANASLFEPAGKVKPGTKSVARSALDRELLDAGARPDEEGWVSRHIAAAMHRLDADPGALNEPMTVWIPRMLFLLLPLFALLLRAFFSGTRQNFYFVDHLVFSLDLHSFAFVLLMVMVALTGIRPDMHVGMLLFVVLAIYFLLALRRFYRQSWIRTGLKGIGIAATYSVLLSAVLCAAVFASLVEG